MIMRNKQPRGRKQEGWGLLIRTILKELISYAYFENEQDAIL